MLGLGATIRDRAWIRDGAVIGPLFDHRVPPPKSRTGR
jgi:hypothetical protein